MNDLELIGEILSDDNEDRSSMYQQYVDDCIKNKILMGYSKEFISHINRPEPYTPSLLFSWHEKICKFLMRL